MAKQDKANKIVVKFGGSSLADHERLLKAVNSVVNEAKKGTKKWYIPGSLPCTFAGK